VALHSEETACAKARMTIRSLHALILCSRTAAGGRAAPSSTTSAAASQKQKKRKVVHVEDSEEDDTLADFIHHMYKKFMNNFRRQGEASLTISTSYISVFAFCCIICSAYIVVTRTACRLYAAVALYSMQ
jgi:hypothetical protein